MPRSQCSRLEYSKQVFEPNLLYWCASLLQVGEEEWHRKCVGESLHCQRQVGSQGSRMLMLWSFPHVERNPYLSEQQLSVQNWRWLPAATPHHAHRGLSMVNKNTQTDFSLQMDRSITKKGGEDRLADNWAVACASGRNNFSGTDHGSGQWTVWAFIGDIRLNRQWCALHLWHCGEKNVLSTVRTLRNNKYRIVWRAEVPWKD